MTCHPDTRSASPASSSGEMSDEPESPGWPFEFSGPPRVVKKESCTSLLELDGARDLQITEAPSPQPTADTPEQLQRQADLQVILSTCPTQRKRSAWIGRCFRILDVPLDWDRHAVQVSLAERIARLPAKLDRLDLYADPNSESSTQLGLITLSGLPDADLDKFVQSNKDDDPERFDDGTKNLTVDRLFHGLTQVNTPVGEVVADVIAIGGLGGHAYDSWVDRDTGRMWLRDILPEDVKESVRVMTFGYPISMHAAPDLGSIHDYVLDFLEQIKMARKSVKDRPLILVGHDLGGIIICQMLLYCQLDKNIKHILEATRLLMFFGTPHGGLRTKELLNMAVDLQCPDETGFRRMLDRLTAPCGREHRYEMKYVLKGIEILTFYEGFSAPCVAKDPVTGRWARTGDRIAMVDPSSAELYLPDEEALPIWRDHWEMATFPAMSDNGYRSLSDRVHTVLKSIRDGRTEKSV